MAGIIRITSGSVRGRQVTCVDGKSVRPTSSRVREAIFSILGGRVVGAQVLDLYAGVGTLGLEALSRGAKSAHFVEGKRRHFAIIHANLEHLNFAEQSTVTCQDVGRYLGHATTGPFDIVFVDPPYEAGELPLVLPQLFESNIMSPTGIVVVEHPHGKDPLPDTSWPIERTYKYGSTAITLLVPPATDANPDLETDD